MITKEGMIVKRSYRTWKYGWQLQLRLGNAWTRQSSLTVRCPILRVDTEICSYADFSVGALVAGKREESRLSLRQLLEEMAYRAPPSRARCWR